MKRQQLHFLCGRWQLLSYFILYEDCYSTKIANYSCAGIMVCNIIIWVFTVGQIDICGSFALLII